MSAVIIAAVVVVLLLLVGGIFFFMKSKKNNSTPNAPYSELDDDVTAGMGAYVAPNSSATATSELSNHLRARALYSYVGQEADELSFKDGDELTLIGIPQPNGWCEALSNGQHGLIPYAFVEVLGAVNEA
eukprot:TRINITY_DN38477_c0_g1_i1.p1 TRINITY_DN38477_c0_g1~~TRINITY_DN38477_c0_g1_i1.p1  ORF type:complete len:130 (+),score=12.57 TRINITY_DN38477_c0_g1_i1:65-454(+)